MHFTDYPSFHSAFVGFAQYARRNGLSIGLQECIDSAILALEGIWLDRTLFKYGLSSLFCQSTEDLTLFDQLFQRFWMPRGSRITDKTRFKNKSNLIKQSQATVVMLGQGKSKKEVVTEEAKTTSGASRGEQLRYLDFSVLSQIQMEELDELIIRLLKEMKFRLKRRRKRATSGILHLQKTIRKSIQRGGALLDLAYQEKQKDRYRLLVLLDVSGSMDKYSFYLLRFLWALRSEFKHVEVFVFSTQLMRITDFLIKNRLDLVMNYIGKYVTHWSSGTKIGESFKQFNQRYAKRYLNGKTLTIILSDGLETGDVDEMHAELKKIKMRSKGLVWLNPLKGMSSYQPIQKGMSKALPLVDQFQSAHNLNSLLELEKILHHA